MLSWENDNKQDEYVQSLLGQGVNILIKQAWYDENVYPHILKNVKEMYHKHKNLPDVHIINSEVNIFEAISLCDVLVSEESNTMFEAMLMGNLCCRRGLAYTGGRHYTYGSSSL